MDASEGQWLGRAGLWLLAVGLAFPVAFMLLFEYPYARLAWAWVTVRGAGGD